MEQVRVSNIYSCRGLTAWILIPKYTNLYLELTRNSRTSVLIQIKYCIASESVWLIDCRATWCLRCLFDLGVSIQHPYLRDPKKSRLVGLEGFTDCSLWGESWKRPPHCNSWCFWESEFSYQWICLHLFNKQYKLCNAHQASCDLLQYFLICNQRQGLQSAAGGLPLFVPLPEAVSRANRHWWQLVIVTMAT